jgi:membrane protease YdiL (CAAX protease family)
VKIPVRTLLAFVVIFATYAFAFRPEIGGTALFFWIFGLPHLALAALAVHKLWDDGVLCDRLVPRGGDIAIGVIVAFLLLLSSWAARATLTPPGTSRSAWLFSIYLQLGDPELIQRSFVLTLVLLVIALSEELVWRGMVLEELNERLGTRVGWIAAALLYCLASLPTAYTLRDSVAGLNPLIVFATLGCGLVWTFMAGRLGRLVPGAVSHMVFTYFSAVQFHLPF